MNKEGSRVICNPVPTSFQAHRVTYDSRPFLVHLVFADLSSLHLSSFHEMIFTLVYTGIVPLIDNILTTYNILYARVMHLHFFSVTSQTTASCTVSSSPHNECIQLTPAMNKLSLNDPHHSSSSPSSSPSSPSSSVSSLSSKSS